MRIGEGVEGVEGVEGTKWERDRERDRHLGLLVCPIGECFCLLKRSSPVNNTIQGERLLRTSFNYNFGSVAARS